MTPEDNARHRIDATLQQCGWTVQDKEHVNLSACRGVAVREVSLERGHGEVDYLLFADGKAIATVEAKPSRHWLVGVEEQSTKYVTGLPPTAPAWGSET